MELLTVGIFQTFSHSSLLQTNILQLKIISRFTVTSVTLTDRLKSRFLCCRQAVSLEPRDEREVGWKVEELKLTFWMTDKQPLQRVVRSYLDCTVRSLSQQGRRNPEGRSHMFINLFSGGNLKAAGEQGVFLCFLVLLSGTVWNQTYRLSLKSRWD